MSLDVHLKIRGQDSNNFNLFESRYLAVNFAIDCEKGYTDSFDSWYSGISQDWRNIANKDNPDYEKPTEKVYSANITHNLTKMAIEAKIYEALWRPHRLIKGYNIPEDNHEEEYIYENSVTIYAKDILDIIEKGLKELKTKPEHYKTFDSSNGWGTYKHFVPFVEKYLEALKKFPEAIVTVNR